MTIYNSTIFKTFENNEIDKWTAKIGLFGRSFNDVIESINKRKLDISNLMDSGLASSYSDAKNQVGGIFSYLYPKKDIQSQLIDVDTKFPKIDTSNVKEVKAEIIGLSESVAAGNTTWQKLFDTLPAGKKHYAELGQQMKGQIITEEGLIAANEKARASAIASNNALKQQTLSAKAGSIAMKGLAAAANIAAQILITLVISEIIKGIDNYVNRVKYAKEEIEKSRSEYDDITSSIESMNDELESTQEKIDDLQSKGALTFTDKAELENLKDQNEELERNIKLQEKKKQSEIDEAVSKYNTEKDDLGEKFDSSVDDLSASKELLEYRELKEKQHPESEYYQELLEKAKTQVAKNEKEVLSQIEDFEQYRQNIIDKYGTTDISKYDKVDQESYKDIIKKLQNAYSQVYDKAEYNKNVIEPIFDDDAFSGLEDKLLSYFAKGGSTDFSKLEKVFGENIITALKNACKSAGIDFDSMIKDMSDNAQNTLDKIAPKHEKPNSAYEARQNSIRDYILNDLSVKDRTLLLSAEIPDDVKFETEKDVDDFISSLNKKVNDNPIEYKSFKQAWAYLEDPTDSTFEKTRSELEALAKAGELTNKSFKNVDGATKWAAKLKDLGLSIDDIIEKINKLQTSSDQLSSMKKGISSISSALGEKKNNQRSKKTRNVGVGADTLAGFDDSMKDLKSWKNFEQTLGDGTTSMEQCRAAANKLATEWVNSNNFLSKLNSTNKQYYISQLSEMGVLNAADVVQDALNQKKERETVLNDALTEKKMKLSDATWDDVSSTTAYKEASDKAKKATQGLYAEQTILSRTDIGMTEKVNQLASFIEQSLGAAEAAKIHASAMHDVAMAAKGKFLDTSQYKDLYNTRYIDEYNKKIGKIKIGKIKVDVDTDTGNSSNKNNKNKSSSKSSAQEIDWIARKLTVLQNAIDSTSKRLQNLFSIKTKKSNLNKQISETGKLLKANQKAAKAYQKEANKVKLSGKLKRKVESGDYDIKKYNQKTADKINKYQDYIDKAREARDAVQDNMAAIRDLNQQKLDNIIDWFDKLIGKINAVVSKLQAKNDLNKKIRSMIGLSETGSESTYNEIISNQTSGLTTMTDEYKKYNAERKAQRKKLKTDINKQNKKDRTAYKKSLKKQGLSDSQIKKKMRKYDKKNKNKGKDQLDNFDADTLTKQNELRQAMYEQMSAIIDTAQELANIPIEKLNTNLDELNDQFSDLEKQTELAYEQIEKMNTGLAYYKKSLEEEISTKWKAVETARDTVAEIEGKKNKAAINISALTKGAVNPDDVKSANDLDAIRIQYGDEVAAWVSEYLAYTQSLSDANKQLKDTINEYVDTIEENSKSLIDAEEKIIDKTNELTADKHNRDKQRRSYTDNTLDKRLNSADKNLENTYYDEVTAKKNKRDTLVSEAHSKGTAFGGWESYLEMNGGGTDQQRAIAGVLSNIYGKMGTFNPDTDDYNEITISSETISQIEDGVKEGWIPESVLKSAIESNERVAKALETNNEYQNSKSTFDNETMPEYFKERVNIIMTDSDRKQEKYKKSLDNIDNRIDIQSYGYRHDLRFAQKGITQDQIKANKAEEERLKSELKDAESKGLEKGSDAWNEIYDNIQKVKDEGVELAKQYVDYLWKGFDDIGEVADRRIKDIQNTIDEMDDNMSLKSTQGRFISSDAYVAQSKEYKNQQKASEQRVKDLEAEFAKDMADPANNIEEGSAEWYKRLDEIDQARKDARDQGIKAADAMIKSYDAVLSAYSNVRASIDRLSDEADFYQDILGRDDTINKDTGALTKNGVASIALSYEKMTNDIVKNQQIAKEKAHIESLYNNGNGEIGIEKYNEEMDKLNSEQREIIKNYYDERDAIISLVEEGLQKQLDYLQDIVDKYKEILDKESDLRSYNNTIEEKTKEISSLQKQLAVANAIDTEEGRANAQSLQKQLEDAQKDLDDTEWDKHKSDMEEILDNMMEDAQDFIDDKLDDVVSAIEEIRDLLPDDSSIVYETISDIDEMWGTSLSDGLSAAIKTGDYSTITSKIESSASQIAEIVGKIEESRMAESIEEIPGYLARIENIVSASHGVGNITGYASGGIVRSINRNISRNNDDVLITAKNGEAILDPQQTKLFSQFVQDMPYQYTTPVITPAPLPANKAINKVVNVQLDGMNFNLPNVTDTDSFINAWKTDKKMKNFVSDVVNGTVMGDNSKAMRY